MKVRSGEMVRPGMENSSLPLTVRTTCVCDASYAMHLKARYLYTSAHTAIMMRKERAVVIAVVQQSGQKLLRIPDICPNPRRRTPFCFRLQQFVSFPPAVRVRLLLVHQYICSVYQSSTRNSAAVYPCPRKNPPSLYYTHGLAAKVNFPATAERERRVP